ncbi:MAG: lipid-A-disaccharide synthase-related protein [Pseudanabaenaceae cyanobacterium bins.39]|nr:lipid-A-disaccharide synthase-related protein [Pseudanabaenaceae cyanobacterium bins.39]
MRSKRVVFISNGHGEDLNACEVLKALVQQFPHVEAIALPLVGDGKAYRRAGVEIIAPTKALPSGGFAYMSIWKQIEDFRSGLIALTWQQIQAARRCGQTCDFAFATGDVLPAIFAYLTGLPYAMFLVSSSAFYENRYIPRWEQALMMRSPRCKQILTRDAYSAELIRQRGYRNVSFAGYPIMDVLEPVGKDLLLCPDVPMIALLTGSRLPEAAENLLLQMRLCVAIAKNFAPDPVQFRAALVPSLMPQLPQLAAQGGWQYADGKLYLELPELHVSILCFGDAFPDILHGCNLAIGMAGTAVEQAVGLGKPVIQIIGKGPQFSPRFADAQQRLLGLSVQTIGTEPADEQTLQRAAVCVKQTLSDRQYLAQCQQNGLERVGAKGGSARLAKAIAQELCK